MASLALVVSLIFFSLILIGPLSYIICLLSWIPSVLKYILGIVCAGIGLWAIFIPVVIFQILGLINFSIGIKIILETSKKTTQA